MNETGTPLPRPNPSLAAARLDWTHTLLDVIDARSFSSLWYWIVLTLAWLMVNHWVLGVPFDLILRARRDGGQAAADLRDAARIGMGRILHAADAVGAWAAGFGAFAVSALLVLAVWHRLELAQAVLFLLAPLALVAALSVRAARRIEAVRPDADELARLLLRHRLWTQGVGFAAIFATALFGMAHNLAALRAW